MATPSTDAPVTPLRQRMQHDMLMRGLGSHTQQDYVRHVRRFAAFLGRSPDTATPRICAASSSISMRTASACDHQQHGLGAALPVHGDARAPGSVARPGDHPLSAQAARGAERRGSGAAARSGTGPQVQGRARRRLWRGPARLRGRAPQGRRHRRERMLLRVEQGKGRRIATPCSRRNCWNCCGCGGAKAGGAG